MGLVISSKLTPYMDLIYIVCFFCLGRVGGDVNINLKLQDYNIHIPIIYLLNIFFPQYGIRNQW